MRRWAVWYDAQIFGKLVSMGKGGSSEQASAIPSANKMRSHSFAWRNTDPALSWNATVTCVHPFCACPLSSYRAWPQNYFKVWTRHGLRSRNRAHTDEP